MVALRRLWVRNYRSLLDISLEPAQLTVVIGQNGAGKTNLYRALRLLSRGAEGRLATTLLEEGGMPSIVFAGDRPRRKGEPVRTAIGIDIDEVCYELRLGLPQQIPPNPFVLDPEIKEEQVWIGRKPTRANTIADRAGTTMFLHDVDARPVTLPFALDPSEPFLSQIGDPGRYPEVFALRAHLGRWRFYHEFPTDQTAPARFPQVGVRTRSWPTTDTTWPPPSPPSPQSATGTPSTPPSTTPSPAATSTPRSPTASTPLPSSSPDCVERPKRSNCRTGRSGFCTSPPLYSRPDRRACSS